MRLALAALTICIVAFVLSAQSPIDVSSVTNLSDQISGSTHSKKGKTARGTMNAAELPADAPSTDCVHVDGSFGPCGAIIFSTDEGAQFIDDETPSGPIDSKNSNFTLSLAPSPPSSLLLFRDGIRQRAGVDYDLSNNVITFHNCCIPAVTDVVTASYYAERNSQVVMTTVVGNRGSEFARAGVVEQITQELAKLDVKPNDNDIASSPNTRMGARKMDAYSNSNYRSVRMVADRAQASKEFRDAGTTNGAMPRIATEEDKERPTGLIDAGPDSGQPTDTETANTYGMLANVRNLPRAVGRVMERLKRSHNQ